MWVVSGRIAIDDVVVGVGEGPKTNSDKVCDSSGVVYWLEHNWHIWDVAGSYGRAI